MTRRLIIIERCKDCEHSAIGFITKTRHCGLSIEHIEDDCPEDGTPDWCPLPAMPEYESVGVRSIQRKAQAMSWNDVYTTGYVYGWNACLDEIGGNENG